MSRTHRHAPVPSRKSEPAAPQRTPPREFAIGSEKRLAFLARLRTSIWLNHDLAGGPAYFGAKPYTAEMRQAVRDGLAEITTDVRRYRRAPFKLTKLVLTEKGRAYLQERGVDPDGEPSRPIPSSQQQPSRMRTLGEARRVLVNGARRTVRPLRLRPSRASQPSGMSPPWPPYVCYSFHTGEAAYFFEIGALTDSGRPLIPAGKLRRTGNGWVMDPYQVLRAVGDDRNHDWSAEKRAIATATHGGVQFIERHDPFGQDLTLRTRRTLYMICAHDADLIMAKMILSTAQPFTGFEMPTAED